MSNLLTQSQIKQSVALGGKLPSVFHRPIETKKAIGLQARRHSPKHRLNFMPSHNMSGIGAINGIKVAVGPVVLADIEADGWAQIGRGIVMDPLQNCPMVFNQIAGLPGQVGQLIGKPHRVLTGARTNFQQMSFIL